MTALKITQIGNLLGVILPKELLAELGVGKGDTLYAVDVPDGVRRTTADLEFEQQMAVARKLMKRWRKCCAACEVTVRLSRQLIIAIDDEQLAEHGGPLHAEEGLLESALARPLDRAGYGDPDIAELGGDICDRHRTDRSVCRW